jgi:hypothetical protein
VTTLFGQAPANHLGHEGQVSVGSPARAASRSDRMNVPQAARAIWPRGDVTPKFGVAQWSFLIV